MKEHKYEIIVAGGGPAGCAAAVSAARAGRKVLLIERYGFLGGMGTAGLVSPFMSHYAAKTQPADPSTKIKELKVLNRGIYEEILNRLEEEKSLIKFVDNTSFDVEKLKALLMDMVLESGVSLLLHSFVYESEMEDGRIKSVSVINKSGCEKLEADIFIDATGDGDLAAMSGAMVEMGDAEDGKCQPASLMFKMANVDFYTERGSVEYPLPEEIGMPCGRVLFFMTTHPGEILINMTRVIDFDATDAEKLTDAEITAREQVKNVADYLIKRLPLEEWYEIPYRCLVPLKVNNLLVAGRCISATHEAQSSLRIMPNCFCFGQAAGIAASIAAKEGIEPKEIEGKRIVEILKEENAL